MPVPSSITRGEGTFIVTPAGGGPSTFTYNYGQTHDARLEAAVRRDLVRLGRTCGGEVLRLRTVAGNIRLVLSDSDKQLVMYKQQMEDLEQRLQLQMRLLEQSMAADDRP